MRIIVRKEIDDNGMAVQNVTNMASVQYQNLICQDFYESVVENC